MGGERSEPADIAVTVAPGTVASDRPGSSPDWGRFTPGTLFADRFRIVAPLGRGGMGEVYRADDLRLGQTVALKLLPDNLAHDAGRLAQFHNEVRIARTIAHRNVCRTYDIGDADGRPFLTMEYVDGEDLASLLHRIGRLPEDKAVEVARQICAGLAAAHERGVLHRDLKPANVMIDGDGHVRLTDFGLASVAGAADNIRAGTPAYMAPEQLAGREVTQRSDIYSLGLVLFELFTGKRAFDARTLDDLVRMQESDSVQNPSTHVKDLDPTIERAIMRCLEHDPARRPASALAVAASLPGGDQLAAALAAGETPSPEMVAAAGGQSAVRPAVGLAWIGFTAVMIAVLSLLSQRYSAIHRVPFPRSNDTLKDRAQDVMERLGYREPPADQVYGWTFSRDYFTRPGAQQRDQWAEVSTGRTGTATFWYRTGPVRILPSRAQALPTENDPPFVLSDMRIVRLDPFGRLVEFQSLPPQVDERAEVSADVDWAPAFESAGLSRLNFQEVPSTWLPRGEADRRTAWEGQMPDLPSTRIRVEAASYKGRPIYFSVIAPWTQPTRMIRPAAGASVDIVGAAATLVGVALLIGAAVLARRNLRSGRGDRRGAFRTAAIVFVSQAAALTMRARHYDVMLLEWSRLRVWMELSLFSAALIWLLYIALEPWVRRFYPQLMIGWTRMISGRLRDPLVGRDVLVGAGAGTVAALMIVLLDVLPRVLSSATETIMLPPSVVLLGTRYAISLVLTIVDPAFTAAVQILAVAVFIRIFVSRTWVVFVLSTAAIMPIAMNNLFTSDQALIQTPIFILGVVLMLGVLLRFGLLALFVTFITMYLSQVFPLTTDMSRPYAGTSVLLMLGIAGVALYGFYASRGTEPLFGRELLKD